MTEFMNMWKNFANFSDRTNVRGYWMAVLFYFITAFVLGFVVGVIAGLLDNTAIVFLAWLYPIAAFIPLLAMSIRRLRDAGREWYFILFYFIPIVGWIVVIYFLVQPSKAGGKGSVV